MPITVETTINQNAAALPAGYNPPTTTIAFTANSFQGAVQVSVAAAGTANAADPVQGATDFVTAVHNQLPGKLTDDIGLDATSDINVIARITRVERKSNGNSIFLLGTDNFEAAVALQWEVV